MKIRFSLRALVVCLIAACVMIAYFGREIHAINEEYQDEQELIQQLEKEGYVVIDYTLIEPKWGIRKVGSWFFDKDVYRRV